MPDQEFNTQHGESHIQIIKLLILDIELNPKVGLKMLKMFYYYSV